MSDFTKFWLDTAALQSAASDCFPFEAELQHDRDLGTKAAQLTEYCQCGGIATTECPHCGACLCDEHEGECCGQ